MCVSVSVYVCVSVTEYILDRVPLLSTVQGLSGCRFLLGLGYVQGVCGKGMF